jgi:hypothetical protein
MYTTPTTRIVKSLGMIVALLCLTILFQVSVQADTLTIIGSSNSQNPLAGSSGQVGFIGQAFNNNFNVTANGQTFDFVFGQHQLGPGAGAGDSGCTDGPCSPLTLTGSLTTPIGALSFGGFYEETNGAGRELTVDWQSGSGPFNFSTPEGGTVIFTVQLLDFFGRNTGATPLLFNQMARITITSFQPGSQTPVPEPATMLLLGTGIAGLFASRRARKQAV